MLRDRPAGKRPQSTRGNDLVGAKCILPPAERCECPRSSISVYLVPAYLLVLAAGRSFFFACLPDLAIVENASPD
jgi:hypothetical protein